MKQLFALCIVCVLMFSSSIISAQDASEEGVIVLAEPVASGEIAAQSQTETMTVPNTAPEAMPQPQRGPGWAQVVLLFFTFGVVSVIALVAIFLWCRIYSKTGYAWAFGLLMIVPVANFVMLCVLAFSEWPVLKEVKSLRQQVPQKPPTSI